MTTREQHNNPCAFISNLMPTGETGKGLPSLEGCGGNPAEGQDQLVDFVED